MGLKIIFVFVLLSIMSISHAYKIGWAGSDTVKVKKKVFSPFQLDQKSLDRLYPVEVGNMRLSEIRDKLLNRTIVPLEFPEVIIVYDDKGNKIGLYRRNNEMIQEKLSVEKKNSNDGTFSKKLKINKIITKSLIKC